jgi:hypothetical protein
MMKAMRAQGIEWGEDYRPAARACMLGAADAAGSLGGSIPTPGSDDFRRSVTLDTLSPAIAAADASLGSGVRMSPGAAASRT